MSTHEFGGQWTEEKLEVVCGYLKPYMKIFKSNSFAKTHYRTIYLDAFAGSGSREERNAEDDLGFISFYDLFGPPTDEQARRTPQAFKGSARLALEVEPPFDSYVFIERKREFVEQLDELRTQFPNRSIEIQQAKAKAALERFCTSTNWNDWRAVAFLDPYGMQVDWHTIETIASTKAIDLWLLWPIGLAINRILPRDRLPDEGWAKALTSAFGTDEWLDRFYQPKPPPAFVQTIMTFDNESSTEQAPDYEKTVNIDGIKDYFLERLNTVFSCVAPAPRLLFNSQGRPIYLLCFASHNQAAQRIANHLLKK